MHSERTSAATNKTTRIDIHQHTNNKPTTMNPSSIFATSSLIPQTDDLTDDAKKISCRFCHDNNSKLIKHTCQCPLDVCQFCAPHNSFGCEGCGEKNVIEWAAVPNQVSFRALVERFDAICKSRLAAGLIDSLGECDACGCESAVFARHASKKCKSITRYCLGCALNTNVPYQCPACGTKRLHWQVLPFRVADIASVQIGRRKRKQTQRFEFPAEPERSPRSKAKTIAMATAAANSIIEPETQSLDTLAAASLQAIAAVAKEREEELAASAAKTIADAAKMTEDAFATPRRAEKPIECPSAPKKRARIDQGESIVQDDKPKHTKKFSKSKAERAIFGRGSSPTSFLVSTSSWGPKKVVLGRRRLGQIARSADRLRRIRHVLKRTSPGNGAIQKLRSTEQMIREQYAVDLETLFKEMHQD